MRLGVRVMYRMRTDIPKRHLERRWALPERVFFACGACHILAYAFLERYGSAQTKAIWLKPAPGFIGNHIFIATDSWVFDYHGYSAPARYLDHTFRRARHFGPGWNAARVELPRNVLISEPLSKTYDGLWLREPGQFFRDALPRARAFLDRFSPPPAW